MLKTQHVLQIFVANSLAKATPDLLVRWAGIRYQAASSPCPLSSADTSPLLQQVTTTTLAKAIMTMASRDPWQRAVDRAREHLSEAEFAAFAHPAPETSFGIS